MKILGNTDIYTDLTVSGQVAGQTKSFLIPHPTNKFKKLRYGSLEGPENGVYFRGRLTYGNAIFLPDYWYKLVDVTTMTVHLTPAKAFQNLYVKSIDDYVITIGNLHPFSLFRSIDCFYTVYAERIDVPKLEVEIAA